METKLLRLYREMEADFKSHHSGMETSMAFHVRLGITSFKSHHSGMETEYL